MPLDIDGAGRSSTLACLPTARGTVAPTRGLGTSTGSFFRQYPKPSPCAERWVLFFRVDPGRVRGGPGPPLLANFGTTALGPKITKNTKTDCCTSRASLQARIVQALQQPSRASEAGASGACKGPGSSLLPGTSNCKGLLQTLFSFSEPAAYK